MTTITLNPSQAVAVAFALDNYGDGEPVTLTQVGDNSLALSFSLVEIGIDSTGAIEEL